MIVSFLNLRHHLMRRIQLNIQSDPLAHLISRWVGCGVREKVNLFWSIFDFDTSDLRLHIKIIFSIHYSISEYSLFNFYLHYFQKFKWLSMLYLSIDSTSNFKYKETSYRLRRSDKFLMTTASNSSQWKLKPPKGLSTKKARLILDCFSEQTNQRKPLWIEFPQWRLSQFQSGFIALE